MFVRFEDVPLDGILLIAHFFRADACENKIDLGIGVYEYDTGETIVLPLVKFAETHLLTKRKIKSYVGPAGDAKFYAAMAGTVPGDTHTHRIPTQPHWYRLLTVVPPFACCLKP